MKPPIRVSQKGFFKPLLLIGTAALGGCAQKLFPPDITYDDFVPAVQAAEPPSPVQVVELPKPLPLPGQLKPVPGAKAPPEAKDPKDRITQANKAARVQPVRNGFINAVQVYPFSSGALYQVYAAPGQVTDVALQPGEQLVGSGPVAAGDTVRWIIGDTESGTAETKQVHILVKPTRPDLQTNLVINTDRRTYHLELNSTEKTYMASVSWQYPQDQLIALRRQNGAALAAQPVATGVDISSLNFRYEIEGDTPAWRPLRSRWATGRASWRSLRGSARSTRARPPPHPATGGRRRSPRTPHRPGRRSRRPSRDPRRRAPSRPRGGASPAPGSPPARAAGPGARGS